MGYEELKTLADSYPAATQEDLTTLAGGYQRRNEGELLELVALAADLSTDSIVNWGLEPEPDPQVLEALERHYHPNSIPEDLAEMSDERVERLVHAVKGIYFEVLVRDRLNAGETLGELYLEPGQIARLAEETNEPGWDLEILDRNGDTVEQLQAKAHKHMVGIYEALREHPNFRVVVPEHIDGTPDEIIRTDVSLNQLTEDTEEQLSEISEGAIDNVVDVAAETALDVFPLGSALLIVATEGRHFLMGRATFEESLQRSGKRLIRPTAYGAAGTALSAVSTGLIAVPIVMGARVAEARITGQINLADGLVARTTELNQLNWPGR